MARATVFILDASYPSADVALPIDDATVHVVVTDCEVEPPPGHMALQLAETTSIRALLDNLRMLRTAWRTRCGEKIIVVATPTVRSGQTVRNLLYAAFLSTRAAFTFDGCVCRPLVRSWRVILQTALFAAARRAWRAARPALLAAHSSIAAMRMRRGGRTTPADQAVIDLFGVYDSTRSFSLPVDELTRDITPVSLYGNHTRGWYLPMLSHRHGRYRVHTHRHRIRNVHLHVKNFGSFEMRFVLRQGRMLDYPYLLGKRQRAALYGVTTCRDIKSLDRGIDLLPYTGGYYHWLVEGVPRVLDLIDDGIDFNEYPLILPPLESFHRDVLEALGISPRTQVVSLDRGDWCHVGECIVPTANFAFAAADLEDPSGQPHASLLRRIRERLLERLPRHSRSTPSRLYISRARAAKRRFTPETEEEVKAILSSEGYQPVCLEELPWSEQVLLVSGTEAIAGLHGAGLANILFAQARSLLEFQNPLEARSYFAFMARELDMEYAYVIGSLVGRSSRFDNITLDARAVATALRQLEAGARSAQQAPRASAPQSGTMASR